MKTKVLGFVIFLFTQYTVLGQAAASWNYDTRIGTLGTTYSWIDCSGGTTILSSGDDVQTNVSWPFNFKFYNNNYTTTNNLSVASNGFIRLDGEANGGDYNGASSYNLTTTATNFGQIIAMAMYDGNVTDNTAWIKSLVTGTAPYRIFTIEYNNLEISYSDNRYVNVQVSFYETTNKIVQKLGTSDINKSGVDIGIHSGIATYFNKWQEVVSGTQNTWIEYSLPIEVNATLGNLLTYYPTLKSAFDAINTGTHKGVINIKINNSTTETASAVLNASGTGSANYSSVNIYPTQTDLSINGNLASPLIDLNGADNVTIDGRVNATGSTPELSITNTSISNTAGTSTIRLINGATNNTIKYNSINGSETNTTSGIVFFSTTNTVSGNSTNTINNNNITNASNNNRPVNAIYSLGTTAKENSGNIINNNSIYDFLKHGTSSNGIFLSSFSNTWTIDGNSFFETTSFVPTSSATYSAIYINNPSGNNFILSNNYIGGSAALCGGTWTKTNATNNIFDAISLNVGTTTASSIQNNTIKNYSWGNSDNAVWKGIEILGGNVNIGTITGNTIGASTGTGAITVTGSINNQILNGIDISSTGTIDCQNNTIGSITVNNATTLSGNFYGINKTATAGTTTISNNTIGSTTTPNSINASSPSTANAQILYGIYCAGTGTITLSNNTLSNLTNSTTNSTIGTRGLINGIASVNGSNTISNNTIYDLSIANANNNLTTTASICGIEITGTASLNTLRGNIIYNLSNSYISFTGAVIGLYFAGGTGTIDDISRNFIHSLSVTGTGSTAANIYGIKIASGASTYANNIITLSGNTKTTVYGIYEIGAANNNNNLYFNTVYISGSLPSGTTNKSYALWSNASTNIRNFRNNIFMNTRSTTGGSNLHYAAYFNYSVNTNITLNYNDYFVTGTGGVLGYYGSNKTTLPIVTGQDANSVAINPNFGTPGGTVFSDYYIASTLTGVTISGISTDYEEVTRTSPTKMGALITALGYIWQGISSTNFGTQSNWKFGIVPSDGANISFAATPTNDCYLDQNRTLQNITNSSTKRLVLNGKQLTLTANLISTTANQIDASATNSTMQFSGSAIQTINNGVFKNNEIYNLTINNSNNVLLNGNMRLLNNLTTTAGLLDVFTNSSQITYAGNNTQTITANQFLGEKIYDLTIDNIIGVNLNTNFTITHSLVINTGKKLSILPTYQLTATSAINNNGGSAGFILKSNASGTASLIHNTNNVPATVERYISGAKEAWHFLSSPVSNQTIAGSNLTPAGTYGNGTGYDLYAWDEPTPCWVYQLNTTATPNWPTVHSSSNFVAGRGYLYSVQALNPTKEFTGNLNNGTISYPLTANNTTDPLLKGFNLIGNPYPSPIDWKASSGWTRTNLLDSGGGYDMWIWNPAANNYGVYNSLASSGTNGVTQYIAPMQGFFVRATNNANISMTNNVRLHNGANNWMKLSNNKNALSTLKIQIASDSGFGFDEVLLQFGYSSNLSGAAKMFSTSEKAPSSYLKVEKEDLSVRYMTNTIDNPMVPLSFKPGSNGDYKLNINRNNFDVDYLYLEDKKTKKLHNLIENPNYNFKALVKDDFNRFVLHFTPIEFDIKESLFALIYYERNDIVVDLTKVTEQTEVKIYDILGKLLLHKTVNGNSIQHFPINMTNQILIVVAKTATKTMKNKVIIK